MKRYIKSSDQLLPSLKSLKWEDGENEGVVYTARDGEKYYGIMAEWFDTVQSDPNYPNSYCVYVAEVDKEDVMEMVAIEHGCELSELPDQVGPDYDYYWDCEDYFLHENTDSNVIQDIGWYGTENEAFDVAEGLVR